MYKLNKRQKEILRILDGEYPNRISGENFLKKIDGKPEDVLVDIKLLEENKFINPLYGLGSAFPSSLEITPRGKEKMQENFIKRLESSTYENPWPAITVIVTVVAVMLASYQYVENNKLIYENSVLQKPLLITPDVRVQGNSVADLKFIVKNPSHSTDYYYVSGTCEPATPELFSVPQKNDFSNSTNTDNLMLPSTQQTDIPIVAGGEITLSCTNNYVKNPARDGTTYIKICVNIRNIPDPICNTMLVTILKT